MAPIGLFEGFLVKRHLFLRGQFGGLVFAGGGRIGATVVLRSVVGSFLRYDFGFFIRLCHSTRNLTPTPLVVMAE
jgi:hypothetical protein